FSSSRRPHTRFSRDWSSDVCSSDLNRDRLLRVHPRPSTGGEREFAIAIEKSSTLLQRHPRSSYLDDALELIGISQFYLGDFLSEIGRASCREVCEVRWAGTVWSESC